MTAITTLPTDAPLDSGARRAIGATFGWYAVAGEGNGRFTVHPFARAASDAVAA